MHNLSLLESDSNQLIVDNHLFYNFNDHTKSNFTIFSSIAKTKAYTTITGCVLEHILTTNNLTNYEKLYYLLADNLSIISKNNGHSRSCALPSEGWADHLGCSRSLVFAMQSSLVKKGYFIINKDWNSIGLNNRNLITPTLPNSVFNYLNEKYPDRIGDHANYNPLTECKRTYLDRTKLFIKLNYNLLKLISSNKHTNLKQKIMWLGFYTKCYKNYMLQSRKDSDIEKFSNNDKSNFSFFTSYKELADIYSCSTKYLSKSIRALEKLGFIEAQNIYIRKRYGDNTDCKIQERQDQSLWKITLSLPESCIAELEKVKNRSNLKPNDAKNGLAVIENDVDPKLIENCLILGGIKFNLNLEQSDVLKSLIVDGNDYSLSGCANTVDCNDNIDVLQTIPCTTSYIDSIIEELDIDATRKVETKLEESFRVDEAKTLSTSSSLEEFDKKIVKRGRIKSDPHVAKSGLLLIKDLKLNNKDLDSDLYSFGNSRIVDKSALSLSEFYENSLEEKEKQLRNRDKGIIQEVPVPKQKSNKTLLDYYPLSTEQVDRLNVLSGREFSINFVNQLMMKLYFKSQSKVFVSKNHMMSYMSKVLRHEKHQAPMVNHETFRFAVNEDQEIKEEKIREKYLSEVEYNLDTSLYSQLRRKISGLFEPKIAYRLLTESKFECLNELFIIQLPSNISLTDRQQEFLENTVFSVYGAMAINYTRKELVTPLDLDSLPGW